MDTVVDICLKPVYWQDYPEIEIRWDSDVLFRGELDHGHIKTFRVNGSPGDHRLNVEFYNKRNGDTVVDRDLDKAVIINSVAFEGMLFDSFMHAARYWPQYPDSYRDTCRQQDINLESNIVSNYLGWNGVWVLPVCFPIFTWIHETENLGWIYEKNL